MKLVWDVQHERNGKFEDPYLRIALQRFTWACAGFCDRFRYRGVSIGPFGTNTWQVPHGPTTSGLPKHYPKKAMYGGSWGLSQLYPSYGMEFVIAIVDIITT